MCCSPGRPSSFGRAQASRLAAAGARIFLLDRPGHQNGEAFAAEVTKFRAEAATLSRDISRAWRQTFSSARALSRELEFGRANFGKSGSGSCRGGGSPRPERFVSEDAERAAGCEMALDVECVVDGGVNGQEALG